MRNVLGSIVALAVKVLGVVFRQPSWANWLVLLKGAFALPLSADDLVVFCRLTGRTRPPARPVREAWFIIGRRAGKSMIAALIAIYCCCCRTYTLAPGEVGTFVIIAADRRQARVIKRYISGLLKVAAVLRPFVAKETQSAIVLTNGLVIEIHTASFRTIRGYTVIGGVCDETAFWPTDESANPDTEILNALRPAMATVPEAILVCITSPYARRGEAWKAVRDHFGHDDDRRLVALADTATMNPTIDAEIIEQAFRDDPIAAAAEYGTAGRVEFRSDVESYIAEEAIDAVTGERAELPPVEGVTYRAGFDGAGGSAAGGDSQTLAIAHDEGDRTVLDVVREATSPFSPEAVIVQDFAPLLKTYGVDHVTGDRWAGEWPRAAFRKAGIAYDVCAHAKSDLYRALLPRINSGLVELRTIPRLLAQLAGLERRTARGGRDTIDHRPGGHDDVINAAAIVLAEPRKRVPLCMLNSGPDPRSVDQIAADEEARQRELVEASAKDIEAACLNGGWFPGGR